MTEFAQLGLSKPLLRAIDDLGFEQPTAIQKASIPYLLEEEGDLVGLAQTGTGKTAAFGLPILQAVDSGERHTQALILSPTRELCMQITREMQSFANHLPQLQITAVYGGASIVNQIRDIKRGAHIIVATPGRLRDLIRRKVVKLEQVKVLVLDEADEMLNMGFKEEIDDILTNMPDSIRTWLFSATMPAEVRRIASNYMKEPKEISAGERNISNKDIDHQFVVVRKSERYDALRRFLDLEQDIFGLIFVRTRRDAKDLADQLEKDGYRADALHGDLSQSQRDLVMGRFRNRKIKLLVATDVAARGIDVQDISHVFHYNIPDDLAFYTHRSGRTGRAGKKGISLVLAHPRDRNLLRRLERTIKATFTETEIPSGQKILKAQIIKRMTKIKNAPVDEAIEPYLSSINEIFSDLSKEELIGRIASMTFSRVIKRYKNASDLNKKGRERGERPERRGSMIRLFVNIGSMDVKGKREFMDVITEHTGISRQAIGDIELQKRNTFFELDKSVAKKVVEYFNDCTIDDRPIRMNRDDSGQGMQKKPFKKFHGKKKKKFKKWKS